MEYRKIKSNLSFELLLIRIKNIFLDVKCYGISELPSILKSHYRSIRIRHYLLKIYKAMYQIQNSSRILIDDLKYEEFYDTAKEIMEYYKKLNVNFEEVCSFYSGVKKNKKRIYDILEN